MRKTSMIRELIELVVVLVFKNTTQIIFLEVSELPRITYPLCLLPHPPALLPLPPPLPPHIPSLKNKTTKHLFLLA
jgi:hypothetical protein